MKYIGYYEFKMEDFSKIIEKYNQRLAQPDKFPKIIFGPFGLNDGGKGFTGLETDDPEQLMRLQFHFVPEMEWKIIPISDVSMAIPLWKKMKE